MLKEQKQLHRHSSWTETKKLLESDARFKAIESSGRREDYFRDHIRHLDEKVEPEADRRETKKERLAGGGGGGGGGGRDDQSKDRKPKVSGAESGEVGKEAAEGEAGAIDETEDESMDEEEKRREKEKQV